MKRRARHVKHKGGEGWCEFAQLRRLRALRLLGLPMRSPHSVGFGGRAFEELSCSRTRVSRGTVAQSTRISEAVAAGVPVGETDHQQDATSRFGTSMLPHPQPQWDGQERAFGSRGAPSSKLGQCRWYSLPATHRARPRPATPTPRRDLLTSPKTRVARCQWVLQALSQPQCPLEGSWDHSVSSGFGHRIAPLQWLWSGSSRGLRGGRSLLVANPVGLLDQRAFP